MALKKFWVRALFEFPLGWENGEWWEVTAITPGDAAEIYCRLYDDSVGCASMGLNVQVLTPGDTPPTSDTPVTLGLRYYVETLLSYKAQPL